jgi:hypothetical protein
VLGAAIGMRTNVGDGRNAVLVEQAEKVFERMIRMPNRVERCGCRRD